MRMWGINPKIMCRQHLLGEHAEMHMFMGCIKKGRSIRGYIKKGLVEVERIVDRHHQLVKEIIRRGYFHNSPLKDSNPKFLGRGILWREGIIDRPKNLDELISRCKYCKELFIRG